MSKSFKVYDTESGRVVSEIKRVADTVRLEGVGTTSGSASATCTSTDNLWPGMLLVGNGIAVGTTVSSVDSNTAFTLSLPATATNASRFVQALSYIPYKADGTISTKAVYLEHYRDLFEDISPVGIRTSGDGGASYYLGTKNMRAAIVPSSPVVYGAPTGTSLGAIYSLDLYGTPAFAISDQISHTPPREQSQTCSFVHFILDDGTLLPVLRMPSYDIVSAA